MPRMPDYVSKLIFSVMPILHDYVDQASLSQSNQEFPIMLYNLAFHSHPIDTRLKPFSILTSYCLSYSLVYYNKKGLRQCAKLHDFGEVVIVAVPGSRLIQWWSFIIGDLCSTSWIL